MQGDTATFKNGILASLPPDEFDVLRPHLECLDLPLRMRLAVANQIIEHVYFPEAGIYSIVTGIRHDPPIEVGIIGREGFVNLAVVMGTDRSPNDVFVQSAGHGHRMDANRLREAIAARPALLRILLKYAHVFMTQTASTVLANGQAKVSERLARWLVMAHDRVEGDVLHSTHEFLSIMLGVRRSSVTNALRDFEERGVVARTRGELTILNRDGLLSIANGYYGAAEREMLRLYGIPGERR